MAPRGSFHCRSVGSMDDSRGGAHRCGRGRSRRTLVWRQWKPGALLKTSLAQEGADLLGWNQEAGGWITRPGHRAHEVTAGTGEDLLKYQPSTAAQHAPLLGHESS